MKKRRKVKKNWKDDILTIDEARIFMITHPNHTFIYEPRWVRIVDGEPATIIAHRGSLSNRPRERAERNWHKAWTSTIPHMEWWEVGR